LFALAQKLLGSRHPSLPIVSKNVSEAPRISQHWKARHAFAQAFVVPDVHSLTRVRLLDRHKSPAKPRLLAESLL
jgi:hypothetical protein